MSTTAEPGSFWIRPDIDRTKRYDVYVSEPLREVVYRNVQFKDALHLLGTDVADRAPRFLCIEQKNGQSVFIPRGAIVKFCEHGVVLTHEIVATKESEVRNCEDSAPRADEQG